MSLRIRLLYGSEFWSELETLISSAQRRVFLVSAYMGERDHLKYISMIPKGVFNYSICRNDSDYIPKENCLVVSHRLFHGKIYLVDNTIIIGSQNLNNAGKEGEFNTLIETDEWNSSLILYQAFQKIIEDTSTKPEPVSEHFLNFYDRGCPFCGNMIAETLSIYKCFGYGGGFVSEEDCDSYGGEGACKYCSPESRESMGECFCCDHSGCGFGIALNSKNLIYHEFGPPDEESENKAKDFLRLFNFVSGRIGKNSIKFFEIFGFKGKIYETSLERKEWVLKET